MKTRLFVLFLITLMSSVIYYGYWFFSKSELPIIATSQPIVTTVAKIKTVQTVVSAENQYLSFNHTVRDKKGLSELDDLYSNLNQYFTNLDPRQTIQPLNLQSIANCPSCLKLLQDLLLNGNFTRKQNVELANELTKDNHTELAHLLVEYIEKHAKQLNSIENNSLLIIENDSPAINALANFNSESVAKEFIAYLTFDQEIPTQLQDALNSNLNNVPNRLQVANEIVFQFNATSNEIVRNRLLAINHPEALAQLHNQALAQGDIDLSNKIHELLSSNPSKYTIDAILDMFHYQTEASNPTDEILQVAYQLADHQFSGNRLDYIEKKLSQNLYPDQDKEIILGILAYSEDRNRANKIRTKYKTNAESPN